MLFYSQAKGQFTNEHGEVISEGWYAGGNMGKVPTAVNNPAWQFVAMQGPLPQGIYGIGPLEHHEKLGPALPLLPNPLNTMHGRSAFFIHYTNAARDAGKLGGNPGRNSSEGCPASAKPGELNKIETLRKAGENQLTVTA